MWYYGLPLSIMLKKLGYDAVVMTEQLPNILIKGPNGDLTTDFNVSIIADKNGVSGVEGKSVPEYDATGKYIETFMGSNVFEEKFGFKSDIEVTYVGNLFTTKILLTGVKGKGGVTSVNTEDIPILEPLGKPEDYVIKAVKPSMKKSVKDMENLQAIVKLIPTWNILYNDEINFRYDTSLSAVTVSNNITYQEIEVQGDLPKDPVGVKVVKSMLADIVGGADVNEIYSALLIYNATFHVSGKPTSVTSKYWNYRATKSKGHQFKITSDGDRSCLDIK